MAPVSITAYFPLGVYHGRTGRQPRTDPLTGSVVRRPGECCSHRDHGET